MLLCRDEFNLLLSTKIVSPATVSTSVNMTFDSMDYFFLLTCELWNQNTGHVLVRTWKAVIFHQNYLFIPWHTKALVMSLKLMNMGDMGPERKLWKNCGINMTIARRLPKCTGRNAWAMENVPPTDVFDREFQTFL